MTDSTPSEGNDRALPGDKVRDLHDELVELEGLAVALDHCVFSCTLVQEPDAPHNAVVPLVNTLSARISVLSRQLDHHLSNIKETTT